MAARQAWGILGGTFDPVHYGHLVAAECAVHRFDLDRVIFMPAAQPPHKTGKLVLDPHHRAGMVELAIADNPRFQISRLELERPGVSYTIDTIEYLQRNHPDVDIVFIMGMDSVYILDTWKDAGRLIDICSILVVTRPGYRLDANDPALAKVPANFWKRANFLTIPGIDISSTELRRRVREGEPIRYLVPPAVEKYIHHNALYQEG